MLSNLAPGVTLLPGEEPECFCRCGHEWWLHGCLITYVTDENEWTYRECRECGRKCNDYER